LQAQEIYQYTLMATHIASRFSPDELSQASLSDGFPFTKGARLLKVPVTQRSPMYNNYGPGALLESDTRLYDLAADPAQARPIADPLAEARMLAHMMRLMAVNDAPPEAFGRLDLMPP
jgi:hypothetical protein